MSEPAGQANVLAERLQSRQFVYMAELVASGTKNARAISVVVSPPNSRSVNAT